MAYAPYKERGQRQPYQTVGIEAPADVRGAQAQAQGLMALADGGNQMIDALSARDALLADTDARKAFEARTAARNEYFYKPEEGLMNQRGANGVNIRDRGRERLTQIDEEYRSGLSPLAQRQYDEMVSRARLEEDRSIDVHSSQQTESYIVEGRKASVNTALSNAVLNYTNPDLFEQHVEAAVAEQRGLDQLIGTAPAEMAARERNLRSGAEKARILRLAVEDPLGAKAVLDANRDRLEPEAQQALDTALEGPVSMAQANAALAPYIGTPDKVRPGSRVTPPLEYSGDTLRDGLIASARSIGADPLDFATAVSFETGGTFDPMQPGPTTKWGQHRGLIQFGETQALQYGADFSSRDAALRSQLGADGAIARYFRDRGFKPGMSGLDLYSTINAGAPGRYSASDTAAGGTPGDVRDKWENQMDAHRAKAAALLGISEGSYTDAERRAPGQKVLTDANLPITPLNEYVINFNGPEKGVTILETLANAPSTLMTTVDPDFDGDPLTTVAQYADRSARIIGTDPGSQRGQYMDTDAAIEAAMAQRDPKVRDLMLRQISTFDALNAKAKDAEANAAYERAWQDWKLTGNQNIPLDLQLAMGPGKLSTLQNVIASTETGALKTDMGVYQNLMEATADPARMASINLPDYQASLSEGDYRFFVAQQASANAALSAAAQTNAKETEKGKYVDHNTAWNAVEDIFGPIGKIDGSTEATPETIARLQRARAAYSEQVMAFVEREGRAPNSTEMRSIATDMVVPVVIGSPSLIGSVFGSGTLKQAWEIDYREEGGAVTPGVKFTEIPIAERMEVAADLEAAGVTPTEKEVALEYGRRRLARAGMQVAYTPKDVPEWALKAARAKGKSDAEAVAYYNAYMAEQYGSQ